METSQPSRKNFSPSDVDRNGCEQYIYVSLVEGRINQVHIQAYEKKEGSWNSFFSCIGFVGENGITAASEKREGDGKTPAGVYPFELAFGKYENPGTSMNYRQMDDEDVWVDDPSSPLYNTLQRLPSKGRWQSAEFMLLDNDVYDYGSVIGYNTKERVPGAGSAIFMHISQGPTAGCLGMSREAMLKVLLWLDPAKNPAVEFALHSN
ncbi:L,D-transpeptidase family protein [Paenibacillus spongiae]|uniref:L,D-transpeptidase family protein n=1 Tax=Paenibacillus spongiae TaxID=2909671 RepID=A0ABY5S417_9BACL|nr:L,D-transpeptidase family protein [Paenibacillus spongiae]UVI28325.1 L,D-transpeptidase family protein [Paenibacillus spongiae]